MIFDILSNGQTLLEYCVENGVTEEKQRIVDLSSKIVKYKSMLKIEEKDKIVGGN